jgi:hypothetical protein
MNERIKELAEQASHQSPDGYPVTIPYSKDFAEKFAELIVSECMEQVWYTREDGINGNISEVIKQRMKQHFGVE